MSMKKKRRFPLISLLLVAAGAALLLYPTVSDCWNAMVQTRAIASYQERVSDLDEASYADLLEAASLYNAALLDDAARFHPDAQEHAQYTQLLDVSSTGIMGYLEIPCIDMTSPIYHGTSDGVLQIAVGHLEGSSLPVGGKSTHCVLSGHRGLPSARLFSDLDKMREGDVFMIHVLEETLVYEVDQIATVSPDDLTALQIEEGEDLCTLLTCTPYAVNSHRLLVRGHRVDSMPALSEQPQLRVIGQSTRLLLSAALSTALVIGAVLFMRKKGKRDR